MNICSVSVFFSALYAKIPYHVSSETVGPAIAYETLPQCATMCPAPQPPRIGRAVYACTVGMCGDVPQRVRYYTSRASILSVPRRCEEGGGRMVARR